MSAFQDDTRILSHHLRFTDPQGSEVWWLRFEACDRAVGCFMQTMPPVNIGRNVEELAYLVLVHSQYNLALGIHIN